MAGSWTVLSAHRFNRSKEELQTAELLLRNRITVLRSIARITPSFMQSVPSMLLTVSTAASTAELSHTSIKNMLKPVCSKKNLPKSFVMLLN